VKPIHSASPPPEKRINPPGRFITSLAIFFSGCGLVLVIGGFLIWFNHAYPVRENSRLRATVSPDGKLKAVLFRRTSLGKTPFTTHVTIIGAHDALPNRSGKAFIAQGEPAVNVHWLDDKHLVIDEADAAEVILRATQVGDVQISEH